MSAGTMAAVLVVVVLAGGFYFAYQGGYLENLSDLIPVLQTSPQSGEVLEETEFEIGEPEVAEGSVTVSADDVEIEYPTLFRNPRWNHMPIKVYMRTETGEVLSGFDSEDVEYVRTAMKIWEEKTSATVSFEETGSLEDGELIVSWFQSLAEMERGRVVGEGGPTRAVDTGGAFTLIEGGEVFLLPTDNRCVGINRPVHEIGHVLGLGHAPPGHGDIMFSKEIDCRQNITQITVDAIEKLYETPAAPDLVVTDLLAVKRGSFLDVNFTVKNTGLKDSVQTTVAFFADGERIESLDVPRFSVIPRVSPGSGLTSRISGARIPQQTSELLILIDSDGAIEEMNEGNNEARAVFRAG